MNDRIKILFCSAMITIGGHVNAQEMTNPETQCKELGKVTWYRNYDEALTASERTNKDVVLLFQEVPGCATCRNYGQDVLSHPLLVEALEELFIPLAIFNNKGGQDREILDLYNEPSWNNPVVRIIDDQGSDLVDRISGDYSALKLVKTMKKVLSLNEKPIPEYLDLLAQELSSSSKNIEESTFKMYCFWSGEKNLGQLDGILDLESGFASGAEVVKVKYNSDQINEEELVRFANKQNYKLVKNPKNYSVATNDVHYYLRHSIYQYLPLTELQKVKINSALGLNESAKKYLSPTQIEWLKQIEVNGSEDLKSRINETIVTAWSSIQSESKTKAMEN